jgi:hypothetical protein
MRNFRILVAVALALMTTLPALNGQSVTGQISGTVTDSTGATVAGAAVKLIHDQSQQALASCSRLSHRNPGAGWR